jgi:anti-anti-sigma factor
LPVDRDAPVPAVPILVVELSGEISGPESMSAVALVSEALMLRPRILMVDMSTVTFVDASAISALIIIRRICHIDNVGLRLRRPSPRVVNLLELTNLTDHFTVAV